MLNISFITLYYLYFDYLFIDTHVCTSLSCLFVSSLLVTLPFDFFTINAYFCFSLPLPSPWFLHTFIWLSIISLSNLKLQSSCHKPINPCCPLPAMRALPRTLAAPARVEPAQPLANNSLGSSWGSCLWIRNISKSFSSIQACIRTIYCWDCESVWRNASINRVTWLFVGREGNNQILK